jgi:hypothetical protein
MVLRLCTGAGGRIHVNMAPWKLNYVGTDGICIRSSVGVYGLYDEAQRITEMAATPFSTTTGKKAKIHDSL